MKMHMYSTEYDSHGRICLVAEELPWYGKSAEVYCCAEDLQKICIDVLRLDRRTEEYVYCICLDTAGHITGLFEISHGTINQSLVSPREVYLKAFLADAVNVILVHNHPSGDPGPSSFDQVLTKRLAEAGALIGIGLADHIIIGDHSYYSFHEQDSARLEVSSYDHN